MALEPDRRWLAPLVFVIPARLVRGAAAIGSIRHDICIGTACHIFGRNGRRIHQLNHADRQQDDGNSDERTGDDPYTRGARRLRGREDGISSNSMSSSKVSSSPSSPCRGIGVGGSTIGDRAIDRLSGSTSNSRRELGECKLLMMSGVGPVRCILSTRDTGHGAAPRRRVAHQRSPCRAVPRRFPAPLPNRPTRRPQVPRSGRRKTRIDPPVFSPSFSR